jgi:threonine/homoserine/homoserine lactone efflux protein
MGEAIGDILPMAIGVAISVIPIIALILMLITPKARSNGIAFTVGWVLGLCIVGFGGLALAASAGVSTSSGAADGAAIAKLIFGLLFLLLAVKQFRSRPAPGKDPVMPKWMATIDAFTPGKAMVLAAALSGVNPKNLLLTLAAASTIAAVSGLTGSEQVTSMVIFIVLASLTVLTPLVVYLVMGTRATEILEGWKTWLQANNASVMCVLFLVFAAVLIGKGIAELA